MQRPALDQLVAFCYVPDLDATDAFYGGVLGLPLVLDQGQCRIYRVAADAFLGFCSATANIPAAIAQGVILTFVVDASEQVDQWAAYLLDRNAEEWIEQGPTLNERFSIYHLFLKDPTGYLVEIQSFLDPTWPRVQDRKFDINDGHDTQGG